MRRSCQLCNLPNQLITSISLDFEILERVWTSKNVGYSHLKVFGYKTIKHMSNKQRSKPDDKATMHDCFIAKYIHVRVTNIFAYTNSLKYFKTQRN